MTLSTTQNVKTYTGDNSTVAFSFPYLFYADGDLVVTVDGTTYTLDGGGATGYSVSGAENPAGGTVTFNTAPATDTSIIIRRVVDYTQETDFENFDGNPADVTEKQFDLVVMQTQQISEQNDRALLSPIGTALTTNTIGGTIDATDRVLTISTSGPSTSLISSLSTTLDTIITSEASGDFLQYNGSNWVNKTTSEIKTTLGIKFNKDDATTAPTVNDDSDDGFEVGSRWIDITGDNVYFCVDPTVGAAVWELGDLEITDLGSAAVATLIDDDTFATATSSNVPSAESVQAYVDNNASSWTYLSSQATTSGTAFDFTIPSGAQDVEIFLENVSLSGVDQILIQLGDAGGIETTGYVGSGMHTSTGALGAAAYTNGFRFGTSGAAASQLNGSTILRLGDAATFKWFADGAISGNATTITHFAMGSKATSAELTTVRVTRSGTDTFDAGTLYARWR